MNRPNWSRRDILRRGVTAGVAIAVPGLAAAEQCELTPRQPSGPFYLKTHVRGAQFSNDLTSVKAGRPDGEVIRVEGRVRDRNCMPIPGARIEIWQANAVGRYAHPRDPNPAPLDPNFVGWGEAVTDENGLYTFTTIKPGAYHASASWTRPPHIHFRVQGKTAGLTTQMYFAGEEHNRTDGLLAAVPKAAQRMLVIEPVRDGESGLENLFRFDLALSSGATRA